MAEKQKKTPPAKSHAISFHLDQFLALKQRPKTNFKLNSRIGSINRGRR